MLAAIDGYEARVAEEVAHFSDMEQLHELPAIHHYWAVRYGLPLFQEIGYESLDAVWDEHVAEVCRRCAPRPARFVSLGAGNGDIELAIARRLAEAGVHNLELVLLELNGAMLERARKDAEAAGLGDRVVGVEVDLNDWRADGPADVYYASHSLHHVVALEQVMDEVRRTLRPGGVLLVNDMIGRNGHQRWPEAADLVDRIWSRTPDRYRYNAIHQRVDERYPDVDYSQEGFEGIRAQDILPLLLERFHPDAFITFMNVVEPFVDRVYGPNFDPDRPEDRRFIDAVAELDDAALDLGLVTPTHLVASFRVDDCSPRFPRGRSPEAVVRRDGRRAEGGPRALLEQREQELAHALDDYNQLRGRKAVRAALRVADLIRHPLRRGTGG